MTGQTIATCKWRALYCAGEDTCRLSRLDHGWILIGHARFRDEAGFAALDYWVRCDEGWHTLSADIAGLHNDHEVSIRIERNEDGWRLNDIHQPDLSTAHDLDLSFTPATNLMPLRKLHLPGQSELQMRAAWLRYPETALHPLDQSYGLEKATGNIRYTSKKTGFAARLKVDETGFVTQYPNLWEGEVHHAG